MLCPDMSTPHQPPPLWAPRVYRSLIAFLVAVGIASTSPAADPAFTPVPATHLHNVFRLSTNLFSGSSPDNIEGFEELARLGVRTILSVDGATPDTATARRFGMRYVHLPHGYDGIPPELQEQLAKAGQSLPGPIYVHCHHGKHRGPAAAAILCLADGRWNRPTAMAWLEAAGTATNYAGLYAAVRHFHRPSPDRLSRVPADFPETSKVPGLVEAMVAIDLRWEHLKAIQKAGYSAPDTHPDLHPAQEAVLLWEQYRESRRLPDADALGTEFKQHLEAAEAQGKALEVQLRAWASTPSPAIRSQLDDLMRRIGASCSDCHRRFRDAAPAKPPPKP